jgi:hypothetical protein
MLTRRQMLLATGALLPRRPLDAFAGTPLNSLYDRIPDYKAFHTLAALRTQVRRLQAKYPRLLSITPLGHSKKGEPIELVSVAGGKRSALLVAGVHANEPIGSMTIAFLLEQLLGDDRLRAELGHTWHFVNPIDPDGMRLNEGWFASGPSPSEYFGNFFRPALARQPDYTFPLQLDGYEFTAPPPENLAFRKAIDLVKPDFLYTLHNADYGGAFFISSADMQELDAGLSRLPAEFGIALNPVGEPLLDLPARSPGVFALPMPGMTLQKLLAAGVKDLAAHWPAGDSSTSYAGTRYGTFAFSAEVPYWDDPRAFDHARSSRTVAQALRELSKEIKAGQEILDQWSAGFTEDNTSETELYYALKESNDSQPMRLAQLDAALNAGALDCIESTVSTVALHEVMLQLAMLRPFAMLLRLGRAPSAPGKRGLPVAGQAQLRGFLDQHLGAIWAKTPMRTLPIRALVGVQAKSGLLAARFAALR